MSGWPKCKWYICFITSDTVWLIWVVSYFNKIINITLTVVRIMYLTDGSLHLCFLMSLIFCCDNLNVKNITILRKYIILCCCFQTTSASDKIQVVINPNSGQYIDSGIGKDSQNSVGPYYRRRRRRRNAMPGNNY
jgi:hypothetical protein